MPTWRFASNGSGKVGRSLVLQTLDVMHSHANMYPAHTINLKAQTFTTNTAYFYSAVVLRVVAVD